MVKTKVIINESEMSLNREVMKFKKNKKIISKRTREIKPGRVVKYMTIIKWEEQHGE